MKVSLENEYKMTMTLTIRNLSADFFGGYRCIVRNSLGETDGMIRLYGEWRELEKPRISLYSLVEQSGRRSVGYYKLTINPIIRPAERYRSRQRISLLL